MANGSNGYSQNGSKPPEPVTIDQIREPPERLPEVLPSYERGPSVRQRTTSKAPKSIPEPKKSVFQRAKEFIGKEVQERGKIAQQRTFQATGEGVPVRGKRRKSGGGRKGKRQLPKGRLPSGRVPSRVRMQRYERGGYGSPGSLSPHVEAEDLMEDIGMGGYGDAEDLLYMGSEHLGPGFGGGGGVGDMESQMDSIYGLGEGMLDIGGPPRRRSKRRR